MERFKIHSDNPATIVNDLRNAGEDFENKGIKNTSKVGDELDTPYHGWYYLAKEAEEEGY